MAWTPPEADTLVAEPEAAAWSPPASDRKEWSPPEKDKAENIEHPTSNAEQPLREGEGAAAIPKYTTVDSGQAAALKRLKRAAGLAEGDEALQTGLPALIGAATHPLADLKGTTRQTLEFLRALNYAGGMTPGNPASVLPELPKAVTDEDVAKAEKSGLFKVYKGTQNAVLDAASFFTSPVGVATLGTAGLPASAQRLVAGAFAADMALHSPEQFKALDAALKSKDTEKISEAATGLGLTGLFTAFTAYHAAGQPGTAPNKGVPDLDLAAGRTERTPATPAESAGSTSFSPAEAAANLAEQARATAAAGPVKVAKAAEDLGTKAAAVAAAPHERIAEAAETVGEEAKMRIESGRIAEPGYWLSELLKKLSPQQIEILRNQPEQVLDVLHQFRENITGDNFGDVVQTVRDHYGMDAEPGAVAPPAATGKPLIVFGQPVVPQAVDKQPAAESPQEAKVAPVEFIGTQPGFGNLPSQGLYNLKEDVAGLGVKGSTLSERTILKKGWALPAKAVEPNVPKPGRGFSGWAYHPTAPDILDAIHDLGGIATPSQAKFKGAEYDEYSDAFGTGAARKLRLAKGGMHPDVLLQALQHAGYRGLETESDMYAAVKAAAKARQGLKVGQTAEDIALRDEEAQHNDYRNTVVGGRGVGNTPQIAGDVLAVGDTFTVQGQQFTVEDYDPDSDMYRVQDGTRFGRQYLSADETFHPDPNSHKGAGQKPEFEPKESKVAAMGTAAARNAAKKQRAAGQAQGPIQTASKEVVGAGGKQGVWFKTIRAILAPKTLSPDATVMAGILRKEMGEQYRTLEQADFAMREFKREFDKTPVPRGWSWPKGADGKPVATTELPHNYAVMSAIDTGFTAGLTDVEQRFAKAMRQGLDQMIDEIHKTDPNKLAAKDLMENYMPRLWERPEENVSAMMQLNAHSPWQGSKGFLKQRILDYFTDGLKLGLKPVTDNPAELYTLKLGEMARFVAARRGEQYAKATGLRKFYYIYEKMPDGWVEVDDPSSKVYAPPVVEQREAFDEMQRVKTLEMLDMLQIPHERLARIGGKRWGMAQYGGAAGTEKITTKFGGSTFVLWHEFGHIMDGRYEDLRNMTLDSGDRDIQAQLRKLSDARFENKPGHKQQGWWVNWKEGEKRKREFFADETQAKEWAEHVGSTARPGEKLSSFAQYTRRGEEKMAHLFEDYLNAPQKFQELAPDVWRAFNRWLDLHPEVKNPLNDIKPSMTLGQGTTEMFVGGPILLGRWGMPEGAAQVLHNYLMPGLGRYKWFRGFRDIASTLNSVQLFGGFHAQNILNDALYTGPSLALYDVLRGKPVRGIKELARTPVSPAFTWSRGRKIQDAIRNPETAAKEYNEAAQWAVEQNMRTGHGNYDAQMARQWLRSVREFQQAPSTGAAWEALWRTPFALLEKGMGPIMDGLVKPMKHGTFERMARRIAEDNPDAKLEDLRPQLAAAADQTDNTLGQNVYDNAFQNRVMKDVGQLVMRSYGWQFNHYRMMGGAAYDWVKYLRNPKPENVTFRMCYLPSMVAGHAIMAVSLGYLMFGQKPRELMDYFFMRTGKKDEKGNEIRVSFADFMKDTWDDWRSFPNLNKMGSEWSRKLAPMWNMAAEMYQNRDFYGTEIFSSREPGEQWADHVQQLCKDGADYLAKQGLPFSATSGSKYQQAGISPAAGYAASALGYNIASRRSTQTAAEGFFEQKQREQNAGTRTKSEAAQALARSELVKQLMAGGSVTSEQYAAAGGKSADKGLRAKLMYTAIEQAAATLPSLLNVMQGWDLANDEERAKLFPIIAKRIQNEAKRGDKANPLVSNNLGHWQQMLVDWAAKQEAKKQASQPPKLKPNNQPPWKGQ